MGPRGATERFSLSAEVHRGDEAAFRRRTCSAAGRTAEEAASFLLPYLRPGLSLLDCGCGPGSITCSLASRVAPAEAVGVDVSQAQVEEAATLAAERGVGNARFETADVYDLPFADGSFDVVFAHSLLVHLAEPLRALAEMRRVLRWNGLLGLRDVDWSALSWGPLTPRLEALEALTRQVSAASGRPDYAHGQEDLLHASGFAHCQSDLNVPSGGGDDEAFERWTHQWMEQFQAPAFADAVVGQGWAAPQELEAMFEEFQLWRARPDAYLEVPFRETLAWRIPV